MSSRHFKRNLTFPGSEFDEGRARPYFKRPVKDYQSKPKGIRTDRKEQARPELFGFEVPD
jgi:hypothetical protein